MTMTIRKQLSALAWGVSAVCAWLLLVSAHAAVHHYTSGQQRLDSPAISVETTTR